MHPAVYSLFLATFCIGTTEVVIAGLLPQVAAELGVDIPAAGFLVTGYALSVAIGGPILTVVTTRLPRRATLLAMMALFVLGHVLAAVAPNYAVLLLARILTATAHGCFFGIAMVAAVGLVPEGRRGRAMSLIFFGITVASIIGVPAGTYIGAAFGWRATFWILGAIAAAATVAIAILLPPSGSSERAAISVRDQLAALLNRTVLSSFALIILAWTALWSVLTYIAPILITLGGFTEEAVSATMLAFGAGSTVGILAGGRLADLAPDRTLLWGLPAVVVLFVLAELLVRNGIGFSVAVFLLGAGLCVLVTPLQNRVLRGASAAPDLASTLTSSAYNAGIAAGALAGAGVLSAGYGYEAIPVVGIVATVAASALCWLALSTDLRARAGAAS